MTPSEAITLRPVVVPTYRLPSCASSATRTLLPESPETCVQKSVCPFRHRRSCPNFSYVLTSMSPFRANAMCRIRTFAYCRVYSFTTRFMFESMQYSPSSPPSHIKLASGSSAMELIAVGIGCVRKRPMLSSSTPPRSVHSQMLPSRSPMTRFTLLFDSPVLSS